MSIGGPEVVAGKFGGLPYDVILRKYETTDITEDPHQTNDYIRQLLIDNTPDAPFMETDMPRNGNVDPRTGERRFGGQNSDDFLNNREIGKRGVSDPYLPDGTFLDFEFMEKDPRFAGGEINWLQHRDYLTKMAREKKFTESDVGTAEKGMTSSMAYRLQRDNAGEFAYRFRNFDESKMNLGRSSSGVGGNMARDDVAILSTPGLDIVDNIAKNRALTTVKSNTTNIGDLGTTDHEFKIAKYTLSKATPMFPSMNNNRMWNAESQDLAMQFEGQRVPKAVVLGIQNMINQKLNKIYATNVDYFKDSQASQTVRMKLTQDYQPRDILDEGVIDSDMSGGDNFMKNMVRSRMIIDNIPTIEQKTFMDLAVAEFMAASVRSGKMFRDSDLRDEVINILEKFGNVVGDEVYQQTRSSMKYSDPTEMRRQGMTDQRETESIKIFKYKSKRRDETNGRDYEMDHHIKDGLKGIVYKKNMNVVEHASKYYEESEDRGNSLAIKKNRHKANAKGKVIGENVVDANDY